MSTKPSPIFLSHIHEEQQPALAIQRFIIDAIGAVKPNVFLSSDRWQMRPGEVWLERIRRELEAAKIILLLLSPISFRRPWVNFEAGAGWIRGKVIIPVCFAGLAIDDLPRPYSDFQAVALTDDDAAYNLLLGISHHLGLISPPPPPPSLCGLGDPSSNREFYERLHEAIHHYQKTTNAGQVSLQRALRKISVARSYAIHRLWARHVSPEVFEATWFPRHQRWTRVAEMRLRRSFGSTVADRFRDLGQLEGKRYVMHSVYNQRINMLAKELSILEKLLDAHSFPFSPSDTS